MNSEKLENCFEGDFVCKYTLDVPWTKEAIYALDALGRLQYYGSFPRPMFRLSCSKGVMVKGVEGLSECKVIFNRDESDEERGMLEKSFNDAISNY